MRCPPWHCLHRWAYFTVVPNRWYFPGNNIVTSDIAAPVPLAAGHGPQQVDTSDEEAAPIAAWHRIRSLAQYLPLLVNTAHSLGVMALAAQVYMRNGGDVRRQALSSFAGTFIGVAPNIFRPKHFTHTSTLASADTLLLAISAGLWRTRAWAAASARTAT
jgi:hypothetical protein